MGKILIPIEFDTDELLKEAAEIKRLADELGNKVFKFSMRAKAVENTPPTQKEVEKC